MPCVRMTGPGSVHPCAGREHACVRSDVEGQSGSPLRGQGTPLMCVVRHPPPRFTPARAGNTPGRKTPPECETVHPCAGREHAREVGPDGKWLGSPLRGQGTPLSELIDKRKSFDCKRTYQLFLAQIFFV